MNNRRGKANFRNFRILLISGSSSTIMMNNLTSKLKRKQSSTTIWQTQGWNFTTNEMETVYFCLPEFSATKIMTWRCHVVESTESRYNIILGRDHN